MTSQMWVASCHSHVCSSDEAQRCIKHLLDKFGDSPRVEVLSGIRVEATAKPETALEYYNKLLEGDPTNSVSIAPTTRHPPILTSCTGGMETKSLCPQEYGQIRQISRGAHYPAGHVLQRSRRLGGVGRDLLFVQPVRFLSSPSPQNLTYFRHIYALQALSHALLLAPQNPFYVLEFAEIAYASGDIPLAVRTFLLAVDMADDEEAPITSHQTDITLRAWYGVKLVRKRRAARGRKLMTLTELTLADDIRNTIAVSDCTPEQP
jgi:tetratricopeptide (TPR) repeat protein